jgi:pSer/pThr/pTyr-binding forkhead associated (FHA) protein
MSANIPDPLLRLFNVAIVVIIYLFLFRVIRAVWAELREPTNFSEEKPSEAPNTQVKRGAAKTLRIIDPPEARGKVFQISGELTVGRAQGCHISLDDSYTSQLHARIYRQDGQAYVDDLGSTNGTFLNRRKVTAPTSLHNGDRLQIGRTVFEVRK